MPRTFKTTEIHVTTPNEPGALAKVTTPITKAGLNLNACWAYGMGNEGHFYFVTNDNEKATKALNNAGFNTTRNDVVVFETANELGSLNYAAEKLANAGIFVDYCYATTGEEGTTWIVFATKDSDKTLKIIG